MEAAEERVVVSYARERGFIVRKLQFIGRRGAPDRLYLGHGQALFAEHKTLTGALKLYQVREHARWAAMGVTIHVLRSIEEGKAFVDRHSR